MAAVHESLALKYRELSVREAELAEKQRSREERITMINNNSAAGRDVDSPRINANTGGGNIVGGRIQESDISGSFNDNEIPGLDFKKLSEELEKLRIAMRSEARSGDDDIAIGEVAAAQRAAEGGDSNALFAHLRRAGSWAIEIATKIGTNVATAAIQQAAGLK